MGVQLFRNSIVSNKKKVDLMSAKIGHSNLFATYRVQMQNDSLNRVNAH